MSCTHKLASSPQLAISEFDEACASLMEKFKLHGHRQKEWTAVDHISLNESSYLRITRILPLYLDMLDANSEAESSEFEEEEEEEDDEVAYTPSSNHIVVCYDVMFSLSYRVPVVYFAVSDTQYRYPPTMETLYSHIIPPAFRAQTQHVGVIGGITDHPFTNKPVFFIHPCRTSEVMQAAIGERTITAYDYLVMWIGALGKCVGLNMPLALITDDLEVD